jgi:hypothetical protein
MFAYIKEFKKMIRRLRPRSSRNRALTLPISPIYQPPISNFWDHEGCTPKPFFGRRQAGMQRAWRDLKLQQRVLRDRYRAPHEKLEKFVYDDENLFEYYLNSLDNALIIHCEFHYNCNISVWEKIRGINFVPALVVLFQNVVSQLKCRQ